MHQELELKLRCLPGFELQDALEYVQESFTINGQETIQIHDVYYDNEDQDLARHGLSGRARRKSGKAVAEVKLVPLKAALIQKRAEFKRSLRARQAAERGLRLLLEHELGLKIDQRLAPLVELNTRRRKYQLSNDHCQAELCYDQVTVKQAGSSDKSHFSEIEIELTRGSDHHFVDMVKGLQGLPNLVQDGQSKYKRSLQLAGVPQFQYGPDKLSFAATASVDEVARWLALSLYQSMRAFEPGTRLGLDLEQLHKMRVSTRRMRSLLGLFSESFEPQHYQSLRQEYKWLAAVLGVVRDNDVQLHKLPDRRRELDDQHPEAFEALERALQKRWRAGREQLLKALDSKRYQSLCELSESSFGQLPLRHRQHLGRMPIGLWAQAKIEKRIKTVRKALKRARNSLIEDDVHELRKVCKALRYSGEFFAGLYGQGMTRANKALTGFQDQLGDFQDDCVLGSLATELLHEQEPGQRPASYHFLLGVLKGLSLSAQRRAGEVLKSSLSSLDIKACLKDMDRHSEKVARTLLKDRNFSAWKQILRDSK